MDQPHWPLVHLNLTVVDLDRSIAFYRRWFGFDQPRTTYPDGTVFLRNGDAFDLALHPGTLTGPPAATLHFGFRPAHAEQVRTLQRELVSAGVPLTEEHDEPDYVGFKCLDPDGYEIEVYWEPPPAGSSAR